MHTKLPALIPFAARQGNGFLLPHRDGFVAVDVGSPGAARRMVRYVESLGCKPQSIALVVATHLHADHIGGVGELQRLTHCSVGVHRQARRKPPKKRPSRHVLLAMAAALRGRWAAWPALRLQPAPLRIDRWLANGATLPGDWEVVYTPGHTPESICLYHRRAQILLAGDTLVGARGSLWVNPLSDDAEVLAMSLHTLGRLAVKVVYPAHGRPVRGQAAFERALNRQQAGGKMQHLIPA